MDAYVKAQKLGQKYYRSRIGEGKYPYLHVLDEIVTEVDITAENSLGTVEIPMDMIVGTKTVGRRNAFAGNFMPLFDQKSEFAAKWANLYHSLEVEGLNDPIKAYEYMGKFYVQEGNKRVSVMKALGAVSIPGSVTRLIPVRTDDLRNRIYYEFLDFYKITGINYLTVNTEGGYTKLISMLPYATTKWTSDERGDFRGVYASFQKAFHECGGDKLIEVSTADALIRYLQIFGFQALHKQTDTEIKNALEIMWKEIVALQPHEEAELSMHPSETGKKFGIMEMLGLESPKRIKAAFIWPQTSKNSSWNYGHELGRLYLEQVFPAKLLVTKVYDNTSYDQLERRIEQAVNDGCNVIFTTTPSYLHQTLKAALKYPQVKFLNCALGANHPSIRTYYARMYEAKFLLGIVAGATTLTGKIGYIADSPTMGELASIDAFAIGAKMVNPNARILLDWYGLEGNDPIANLKEQGVDLISGRDWIVPDSTDRHFGLYDVGSERPNIAMAVLDWGSLYEKMVQSIMEGIWKEEEQRSKKAINYWWGISSGVVDIICGSNVSQSVKQLVHFLKQGITAGVVNPFSGILYSQNGKVTESEESALTPEQIMNIDWLSDNVIGRVPEFAEFNKQEQVKMRFQGAKPLTDVKANIYPLMDKKEESK